MIKRTVFHTIFFTLKYGQNEWFLKQCVLRLLLQKAMSQLFAKYVLGTLSIFALI